ncbi:hypothetical protein QQG55_1525 [Brugia pahangi]
MRSVTITIFILINIIKQNFGILSDFHNWQFDIPINFSKHQSSDWECLGRISKCFLNAQLSLSSMPNALIVSATNPNTYIGWYCMVQQAFIAKNYHIKVIIQNCSQNRLNEFVKSNDDKVFHYKPMRSFQIYATHKFVYFTVIVAITAYTLIVYLIFCIILAQYEKEIESYEQSPQRKIKQWVNFLKLKKQIQLK